MKKLGLIITGLFLTITAIIWFQTGTVLGFSNFDFQTRPTGHLVNYNFFNGIATTTTATSTNVLSTAADKGYMVIAGAKKVTMYFSRGGVVQPNVGNTRFQVQVSPDAITWYDFGGLIQSTSTSVSNAVVVPNINIIAATSTIMNSLDIANKSFYALRCIVFETTDGEHSCSASAEF
jgi:hypothetical protein